MLTDLLSQLAQARIEAKAVEEKLAALKKAFEEQNAELIAEVNAKDLALQEIDHAVRENVMDMYGLNGEVKPAAGVEVKQMDKADFVPDAARAWAISNVAALLTLDTKAYDKLLREVRSNKTLTAVFGSMPGEVVKEPKVYVASDLSAYLPKKEETK
jgi:hypothetical protein